ncbi:MAG: hypothetical protein RL693_2102 [Verrucomicrobiota bacterium]|jgi:type II secretory pathway pseudopilin PulG
MKITESYQGGGINDYGTHCPENPTQVPRFLKAKAHGFTLIEVSMAFMMLIILSGSVVSLLTQHVFFMQLINNSSFLSEEAPRINAMVSSIVNQADSYQIFGNLADAEAGAKPLLNDGTAVRLTFRNPSGVPDECILSFAKVGGAPASLNYHYLSGGAWSAAPNWVVTSQPASVTFSTNEGSLLVRFVGPDGEIIEFAGNS